jgi:hypothetical protein
MALRGGTPTATRGGGWWPFHTEHDPKEKARKTIEKGLEKTEETLRHTRQAVENRLEDAKMHARHGVYLSLICSFQEISCQISLRSLGKSDLVVFVFGSM